MGESENKQINEYIYAITCVSMCAIYNYAGCALQASGGASHIAAEVNDLLKLGTTPTPHNGY